MAFHNTIVYTNEHKAPGYAFLSQPPPPKRRAPTQPLPAVPVANPIQDRSAKISAWAAIVQPGSPAPPTPCSPNRRSSGSSRRRPSLTLGHSGIQHGRAVSSPYVVTQTPTTASHKTFDFTAVGYNNVFVNMPVTPGTPSPLVREKAMREQALIQAKLDEKERAKEQSKGRKDKVMNKIKSLTNLRTRSKSVSKQSVPDVPPVPPMPVASKPKPKGKINKDAISKPSQAKRSVYGPLVRAPPTLQNELALMQFVDGGRMNDHIRRAMVAPDGAVGDVYRDGKGGVWWDREEEMEYQALLVVENGTDVDSGSEAGNVTSNWVQFPANSPVQTQGRSSEDTLVAPEPSKVKGVRPPSASTLSSRDSDLDPAYLMQAEQSPAYHNERVLDFDLRAGTNATESLKANNASSKRNGALLCLPARPFRAAKHLRKPELLVDVQAFGVVPKSPRSPLSPSRFTNMFSTPASSKPRGKARRRPAPIKVTPAMQKMRRVVAVSSPGSAVPPLPSVAVVDTEQQRRLIKEGKQEFMLDSFQPEVSRFDTDSEDDFEQPSEMKEHMNALKKRRGSILDFRAILKRGA
ncbi:hypothetical protein BKA70DRAFT_469507 [Coprinopsis sp. MPI-PUGE-AT-0042]|nr:hypothetical protein BKA70DRAFT_469507 [Coprinopsis sp. MPI-PUGE-AT-0042]